MLQREDFAVIKALISEQVKKDISDALNYERYLVKTEQGTYTKVSDIGVNNTFVTSIDESMDCWDILNWYRNLYYKEGKNTEQGIMAWVIDDCFKELNKIGFFKNR